MATSTIKKQTETPLVLSIPTGQWSGSGNDYYITVTASSVTANSILVPHYDNTSAASLNGPVWCVPAEGSFTVHTSAIPSGTVNIMVQFVGTLGEAQYQVLADVYSKSQVDSIVSQSTANVVDTSTTLSELKNGMNAIKVVSGTVIGNYTVPNNMRGYAVKDGSTSVGFLASYNGEDVAVVGNNNLNHWVYGVNQSTAKNNQQGTYVASGTVPANTNTTLLTLTCAKTGRYLIIGSFLASNANNNMSLNISVNDTTIRGGWNGAEKTIICVYNLNANDVVKFIVKTSASETFYQDRISNNLTISEI